MKIYVRNLKKKLRQNFKEKRTKLAFACLSVSFSMLSSSAFCNQLKQLGEDSINDVMVLVFTKFIFFLYCKIKNPVQQFCAIYRLEETSLLIMVSFSSKMQRKMFRLSTPCWLHQGRNAQYASASLYPSVSTFPRHFTIELAISNSH